MNYSNWCSHAHPGLLILLVDQNDYMSDEFDLKTEIDCLVESQSFAKYTSYLINRALQELSMHLTQGTHILSGVMKVIIITYGKEIRVSHKDWIGNLLTDENIPIDNVVLKMPDGPGSIVNVDVSLKRVVYPVSSGTSYLHDAFSMVRNIILSEKIFNTKLLHESPVPIIINVTSDKCAYSQNKLKDIISAIKSISFADGKPIICNCVLSNKTSCVNFPLYEDLSNSVGTLKDLYEISSVIPKTYINVLKYMGFKNVQDNASALILNNFLYSISSFSQIQLGGSEPYLLRGNWYY